MVCRGDETQTRYVKDMNTPGESIHIVPAGASIYEVTDRLGRVPYHYHATNGGDALCGVKARHLCFDSSLYGTDADLDCPVCRRRLEKLKTT